MLKVIAKPLLINSSNSSYIQNIESEVLILIVFLDIKISMFSVRTRNGKFDLNNSEISTPGFGRRGIIVYRFNDPRTSVWNLLFKLIIYIFRYPLHIFEKTFDYM